MSKLPYDITNYCPMCRKTWSKSLKYCPKCRHAYTNKMPYCAVEYPIIVKGRRVKLYTMSRQAKRDVNRAA